MHIKTTHPCGGSNTKNDVVYPPIPSLPPYPHDSHRHHRRRVAVASVVPPFMVNAVAATSSWLRNRRIRYVFLFLFSPLILCILFAALPFLCFLDLCLRRRLWRKLFRGSAGDDDRLRLCEEGNCSGCDGHDQEKGLLHRYLEDQLLLVRSMYECGEDDNDEEEGVVEEFKKVQNLDSSTTTPLLV